ncbi:hypothetical protein AGMMS50229_06580 [Campylobacterota bacterium]|nr:hypothetical protein AGMMS50229_06580 [Campylobacterota bacterium]
MAKQTAEKYIYIYRVEWSQEDKAHIASCLEFPSLKAHGNLTLRVPAALHKQLAIRSAEEGVSINQYVLSRIADISTAHAQ